MPALLDARTQMTYQQVRAWNVLAPEVLDAFERLPRELFVPEPWRNAAYGDFPIPLGDGQHMLQPSVAGRLLQATSPRSGERVLEIGTGSGYLTACLALLAAEVTSLEIRPALAHRARENLKSAGIANVEIEEADAFAWQGGAARFDVVILTGSLPSYDDRFESLLRPGGRLLAIVGEEPVMEALLVRLDKQGKRSSQGLFETVVDPLDHAQRVPGFRF
jgi:protein-L-isoaspartate(D-aspartate) O-methyltransferase